MTGPEGGCRPGARGPGGGRVLVGSVAGTAFRDVRAQLGERRGGAEPQPRPGRLARRQARARHQAGQPVRPADVAQPVPRPGGPAGLRGLRVHHGLPADHAVDGARQATARPRGQVGPAARRGRQPGRHQGVRRARLLARARHGQPVGLPDRVGRPAQGGMAGLQHRGPDRVGPDRPHAGAVRDRPAGQGAEALPDPDGVLEHHPVRPGAGHRDIQPAAGPPQAIEPRVARRRPRPDPLGHGHAPGRRAGRRQRSGAGPP